MLVRLRVVLVFDVTRFVDEVKEAKESWASVKA